MWRPVAIPGAASSTFQVAAPGTERPAPTIHLDTTVAPKELIRCILFLSSEFL